MIERRCDAGGDRPSRIRIGTDVAGRLGAVLDERLADRPRFVLADAKVADRLGDGIEADVVFDGGEAVKSFAVLERVLGAMAERGLDRRGVSVAVGGGTIGDLGGLAAALWLRGVDLVMVPTTLLSMVDSSVGGKTAINVAFGKNLVGTFWPAIEVWIDPDWLPTLPDAEFRSGLGEIVKIAIGLDAELFAMLERDPGAILRREPAAVVAAIDRCVAAKIEVVTDDPRESGRRRLLNLGHTLGHALEAHTGFRIQHGIAVARGIRHVVELAASRGTLASDTAARCCALLDALGFAATAIPPADALRPFLARDKKSAGDRLHAVLPTGVGTSAVVPMRHDEFL